MSHAVADRDCSSALQRSAPSVVYFAQGLPGFETLRRWELVEQEEARPFQLLRAVERPQLALLVVEPQAIVDGYRPAIPHGAWSRLGDGSAARAVTLVVVSLAGAAPTANLRAPIVIDTQTLRGEQVLLEDDEWPVRFAFASDDPQVTSSGTGRSPACSSSAAR